MRVVATGPIQYRTVPYNCIITIVHFRPVNTIRFRLISTIAAKQNRTDQYMVRTVAFSSLSPVEEHENSATCR